MLPFLFALVVAVASAQDLKCGVSKSWAGVGNGNPFIIGASDAPRHAYPWTVSWERCTAYGCVPICGGVLVSKNYLITAASCVANDNPDGYRFVLGLHLKGEIVAPDARIIRPAKITRHPSWKFDGSLGFPNNIAVIRLATPAPIDGRTVVVGKLADSAEQDFSSSECWMAGWGRPSGIGGTPQVNTLRHVKVNVISNADCKARMGDNIKDFNMCIFDAVNNAYAGCSGDTGSPLNCRSNSSSSAWTVAGITSWGRRGCKTDFPTVFSRTGYYKDWIKSQIGDNLLC